MKNIIPLFFHLFYPMQSVAQVSPDDGASEESSERSVQDVIGLRDPFRMPDMNQLLRKGRKKSQLELIPLEDFKLVGVMTGPRDIRAMLKGPGNKIFYVKKDDRIGISNGVIKSISTDRIRVEESVTNILGSSDRVVAELRLKGEGGVQRLTDAATGAAINSGVDNLLKEQEAVKITNKPDTASREGLLEQIKKTISDKITEGLNVSEGASKDGVPKK